MTRDEIKEAATALLAADYETRQAAIRLAELVVRYAGAFSVYFPAAAQEGGELATAILRGVGVRYFISLAGDAITCVECRKTSRHPKDIEQRFCGACKELFS